MSRKTQYLSIENQDWYNGECWKEGCIQVRNREEVRKRNIRKYVSQQQPLNFKTNGKNKMFK